MEAIKHAWQALTLAMLNWSLHCIETRLRAAIAENAHHEEVAHYTAEQAAITAHLAILKEEKIMLSDLMKRINRWWLERRLAAMGERRLKLQGDEAEIRWEREYYDETWNTMNKQLAEMNAAETPIDWLCRPANELEISQ